MQHPSKLLKELQITAKKGRGQNFLYDDRLAERLLDACLPDRPLGVLEIGPGLGFFTRFLSERCPWLLAIEIESLLVGYLKEKFHGKKSVKIVAGNALEVSLDELLPINEEFCVVSNLPYASATEILFRLLKYNHRIPRLAVMVQKEVSNRLCAEPGTKAYGRLSILPRIYYQVKGVEKVSGRCFFPKAKVDSQFLIFDRRPQPLIDLSHRDFSHLFQTIVSAIFQWRRKTLLNSLKRIQLPFEVSWADAISRSGLGKGVRRGETLEISEIEVLVKEVLRQKN